MNRVLLSIAMVAIIPVSQVLSADDIPAGHSTVEVVFVVPIENPPGAMGNRDKNGHPVRMATTGSTIVPYDSIRPVKITVDGEFLGHALFGYDKLTPIFVLPEGKRKFMFSCRGFKSVSQELYVLGTGSKQYLIVKMSPEVQQDLSVRENNSKARQKSRP